MISLPIEIRLMRTSTSVILRMRSQLQWTTRRRLTNEDSQSNNEVNDIYVLSRRRVRFSTSVVEEEIEHTSNPRKDSASTLML